MDGPGRTPANGADVTATDPADLGGSSGLWTDAARTLARIDEKSSTENFPVASRLLPRRYRAHLLALYGFARLVDDVGDEAPGDRSMLLDAIDFDLDRVVGEGVPQLAVMRSLAPTVRGCGLPLDPFHRLVEANRRDQITHRYRTFSELLDYCTLSANPVGHLVLGVFGVATPERIPLSDDICTALQLVEHWQDVAEDAARGRIYLPGEDRRRFGVHSADLAGPDTPPRVRELIAFEAARAQMLLRRGAPLVGTLTGPARVAVAGFVAGGHAALDALRQADYQILGGTVKAGRAAIAWQSVSHYLGWQR